MNPTTNTFAGTVLDLDCPADRALAEAVVDLLRRLDALAPEPDLDTWSAEAAVNRAGDVLAEHADVIPDHVHAALDQALDDIASAVEWDIDASFPPLTGSLDEAAGHAARLIDAMNEAGWTVSFTAAGARP